MRDLVEPAVVQGEPPQLAQLGYGGAVYFDVDVSSQRQDDKVAGNLNDFLRKPFEPAAAEVQKLQRVHGGDGRKIREAGVVGEAEEGNFFEPGPGLGDFFEVAAPHVYGLQVFQFAQNVRVLEVGVVVKADGLNFPESVVLNFQYGLWHGGQMSVVHL